MSLRTLSNWMNLWFTEQVSGLDNNVDPLFDPFSDLEITISTVLNSSSSFENFPNFLPCRVFLLFFVSMISNSNDSISKRSAILSPTISLIIRRRLHELGSKV